MRNMCISQAECSKDFGPLWVRFQLFSGRLAKRVEQAGFLPTTLQGSKWAYQAASRSSAVDSTIAPSSSRLMIVLDVRAGMLTT